MIRACRCLNFACGALRRALRILSLLVIGLSWALPGATAAAAPDAAAPLAIEHGSADAFAAPGVALAWGILRGRDEADTRVIVRVEAEPAAYGSLAIDGVDPFTRASQSLLAAQAIGGVLVVRLPRSRFAELPRSEWRFFATTSPRPGDAPALLVYYQGVPDTTPEFDDAAKLDAYLTERIARARRDAKAR